MGFKRVGKKDPVDFYQFFKIKTKLKRKNFVPGQLIFGSL
jgi:hypothetical protein